MTLEIAAKQLEALGSATRLAIYRILIQAGRNGKAVGEVKNKLAIPASTLSHHIAKLVRAGLVTQERNSRTLCCKADYSNMDALMTFMVRNCCSENSCIEMSKSTAQG